MNCDLLRIEFWFDVTHLHLHVTITLHLYFFTTRFTFHVAFDTIFNFEIKNTTYFPLSRVVHCHLTPTSRHKKTFYNCTGTLLFKLVLFFKTDFTHTMQTQFPIDITQQSNGKNDPTSWYFKFLQKHLRMGVQSTRPEQYDF